MERDLSKNLAHLLDVEIRLQPEGDDVRIDIPAGLIARFETENPGVSVRDGIQLQLARRRIIDALLGNPREWDRPEVRRDEHWRVEAWVNELGQLEVKLPRSYDTSSLEIFVDEHPEHKEQVEATLRRNLAVRRHAEVVVGEIYAHYCSGSPSTAGLIESLRGLAADLEADQA